MYCFHCSCTVCNILSIALVRQLDAFLPSIYRYSKLRDIDEGCEICKRDRHSTLECPKLATTGNPLDDDPVENGEKRTKTGTIDEAAAKDALDKEKMELIKGQEMIKLNNIRALGLPEQESRRVRIFRS